MAEPSERDKQRARGICGCYRHEEIARAIASAREEGRRENEWRVRNAEEFAQKMALERDFAREVEAPAEFERGKRAGLEQARDIAVELVEGWRRDSKSPAIAAHTRSTCEAIAHAIDVVQHRIASRLRAPIGDDLTDAEHARRNRDVAIGLDAGLRDCTGCTDPRSEGTHQMGTRQHPLSGGDK